MKCAGRIYIFTACARGNGAKQRWAFYTLRAALGLKLRLTGHAMGGFGHGIETGFQNFTAALGAKTITTLVQALEGRPDCMHTGDLALTDTKIHIPLSHALGVRVTWPGQSLCRHFCPRTFAPALLMD